jgi:Cu/Ag efflux protein CusF
MRKLALTLAIALAAAVALAQSQTSSQPAGGTPAKATAADTKQMTAVVLSTDPTAKTITIKKDMDPLLAGTESEKTLAVDAKAIATLKDIRVGEKVTLHVKTDASGKETVTIIEKPATSAPEKQ